MPGLDEWIAELGSGSLLLALVVALLLGLRHATDPDHLTAVSTLVLSDEHDSTRRAGLLGLFWGFGHATTLAALGIPLVLFGEYLPAVVQRSAELAVGVVIVALALRLLLRWRRGYFHMHAHTHDGVSHTHPHVHEHGKGEKHGVVHEHAHAESLGRSPVASYGIGLVHGVGGSAGAGLLLVAAIPGQIQALAGLLVFAGGTAASMAFVSAGFGFAVSRGPLARRFVTLVPTFGTLSLLFGVWYALAAFEVLPYAL